MSFTDPTASYPSAIVARDDIGLQNNRASFTLSADISNSATELTVNEDTSNAPSEGVLTIADERIQYTGKNDSNKKFTGLTRGFDGSSAASHDNGDQVQMNVVAFHHNRVAQEVIAIQTELGTSPSGGASDIDTRLSNLESPQYLALSTDSALDNERVFTAGDGISLNDGGANGNATVSTDEGDGLTITSNQLVLDESFGPTWTGTHDFSGATLDLPTTTTPSQTSEGRTVWDSDDDKLTIGDGTSRVTIVNESRTLTAGNGLSGGGDLSANRSFSVNTATGLTINSDNVDYDVNALTEDTGPDASSDFVVTYDASASAHKKVLLNNVGVTDAQFVTLATDANLSNERTLASGDGLTQNDGGAGSNITINVGGGTGITANANDVAVDQSFTPTWTGAHTFNAGVTISGSDLTVGSTLLEIDDSANHVGIGGPTTQPATGDLSNDQIIFWFDDTANRVKFRGKDNSGSDITGTLGSAGGNVSNTGTPVDNQLAVWTNDTTIEGDANLTWDGSTFNAIDGTRGLRILTGSNDFIQVVPSDDPGSGALNTNELAFFLDEANDQLQVRWKESGGTNLTETIGSGSGSGSPGGSDEQIQYNNGGSFGGATGFLYDDTNQDVEFASATGIILRETTANLTIDWNDPGAARTLTIPDPGSNTNFLFETRAVNAGSGLGGTDGALSQDLTLSVNTATGLTVNSDNVDYDISSLTEEASPDGASDAVVIHDSSAGDHKKVLLDNVGVTDAEYVTLSTDTGLDNERTLNAADGLSLTDNGANNNVDLDIAVGDFAGTGLESDGGTPADLRIASAAAGNGLTGGSGSALAVGAGTAITVNTNDVQVTASGITTTELDLSISPTWTGTHTFSSAVTLDTGAGANASLSESGIDRSSGSAETFNVQNSGAGSVTLQQDGTAVVLETRTLTGGDGIKALGDLSQDRTIDVDVSDFAGTGLEDDGSENLRIASGAAGNGLTGGSGSALAVGAGTAITVNANDVQVTASGITTTELDTSISPNWGGSHTFSSAVTLDTGGSTNASLSEDGVNRSSSSNRTFNIRNSGAGSMTVQQDGTALVPETRNLAGGTGINTIGDLSANRTISVDQNENFSWTGEHDFNNGDVVLPTKTSDPSGAATGTIWIRTDL